MSHGKILPHSIEAEQSLLAGLMMDNTIWYESNSMLCASDFYHEAHQGIFSAIESLVNQGRGFDCQDVVIEMAKHNQLEACGGEDYLYELIINLPSVKNSSAYIDIIRDRSQKRQALIATVADNN